MNRSEDILHTVRATGTEHEGAFPDVRPLNDQIRREVIKDIELLILNITRQTANGESPILNLHSEQRESRPVKVRFSVKASRRKMALLIFLVSKIHRLLITNSTCSRRELYYERVDLFRNQRQLDETATYVCQLLRRPPWHLCLTTTSKGLIAGDLTILTADGALLNCNTEPTGTLVPKDILGIRSFQTSAKFILIVEKDTVFQKLLKEEALQRVGSILLITGKGYPDINTRLLVWRLQTDSNLPVLILVDADPYGVDIMCTYRFGPSQGSRMLSAPPLTNLRWVGIHPSEIRSLGLPSTEITSKDKVLAASLLKKFDTLNGTQNATALKREVETIISTAKKAEIESLSKCAANFLTDVYLPRKISNSEFI